MSEYTRYLLYSAGIKATEQDITAIDVSGMPYELVQLIAGYQRDAIMAKGALDVMVQAISQAHEKPFKRQCGAEQRQRRAT